ncbi:MAG TPA: hypothetical protein VMW43_09640 [Bacteroidota bacterium]|nr:hypothetical protein [Bacteroidota bacterium]
MHRHHLTIAGICTLSILSLAGCIHLNRNNGRIYGVPIECAPLSELPSNIPVPSDTFSFFADFDHQFTLPHSDSLMRYIKVYFINTSPHDKLLLGEIGNLNLETKTISGNWERVFPYSFFLSEYPSYIKIPAGQYYSMNAPYLSRGSPHLVRYTIITGKEYIPPSNEGTEYFSDSMLEFARYDDFAIAKGDSLFLLGIIKERKKFPENYLKDYFQRSHIPTIEVYRSPVSPAIRQLAEHYPGKGTLQLIQEVLGDSTEPIEDRASAAYAIGELYYHGLRDSSSILFICDILRQNNLPTNLLDRLFGSLAILSQSDAAKIAAYILQYGTQNNVAQMWNTLSRSVGFNGPMTKDSSLFYVVRSHRYDFSSNVFDRIIWCYAFYKSPDLHDYLLSLWNNHEVSPSYRETARERFLICFPNPIIAPSLSIIDTIISQGGDLHLRFTMRNIAAWSVGFNSDSISHFLRLRLAIDERTAKKEQLPFTIDSGGTAGYQKLSPGGQWSVIIGVDISKRLPARHPGKVQLSVAESELQIPGIHDLPITNFTHPYYSIISY